MTNLLSQGEKDFIIEDSKNPDYKKDNLIFHGFRKTDVMQVSPSTGLILFFGDENTGFKHFHERHSNTSLKPFWNEKKKLDVPSKFSNWIIPFFHYLKIADEVFKSENLNLEKNTSKNNFDLYIGECRICGEVQKYRLLLYKETTIIHNLYPETNISNLKLNTSSYARGAVSFEYDFDNCKTSLTIPYKNSSNEIIFEIVIIFLEYDNEKIVLIRKYDNGVIIKEKQIEKSKFDHSTNPIQLFSNQYADLSKYESKFGKL